MDTNSFDAQAITQPGGMYASINDGLLKMMAAYLQSQERGRQDERELVRDERRNRQDQYRQAIHDAQTLGVAPTADRSGWLAPEDQAGITAAKAKFQQSEQDRVLGELAKRMAMIRQGVKPQNMSADEAAEYSRAATNRAREDMRQGIHDKLAGVQLQEAKNRAITTSPMWRAAAGIGNTVSDWVGKGIEAAGRQKTQQVPGMSGAQIMLRDLMLAEKTGQPYMGENNTVVPLEKIPAYKQALQQWMASSGGAPAAGVVGPPAPPAAATSKVVPRSFTEADVQERAAKDKVSAEVIRLMLKKQGHTIVP